jgi:hypothetical protein
MVEYGSTFKVRLAASTSTSSIKAVVLSDPGTTTHSSNMAARAQQLAFTVTGSDELTVTAPADTFIAPPSKLGGGDGWLRHGFGLRQHELHRLIEGVSV